MKKTILQQLIPFGILLFLGISVYGQITSHSDASKQLDFLIGDWELFSSDNEMIGVNTIQLVFGTYTLEANFENVNGLRTQSTFSYDNNQQLWIKTWSDDFGNQLTFKGVFRSNKLVMNATSTNQGIKTFHRIIYKKQNDGTVAKIWQKSINNKEWKTTYSGVYKRKKAVL